MDRTSLVSANGRHECSVITLNLEVREPMLVSYFEPFEEPERSFRAFEALKVGVIALQTACPTLDTQIVKDQFAEMQADFSQSLRHFFSEKDGVVPKSLNDALGDKGVLSQCFQRYFDPQSGRIVQLLQSQVGPASAFAKNLDPKNKDGIVATIEEKVRQLVESKLNDVLVEFSLDEDDSAMSRLKGMISKAFDDLRLSLNLKAVREEVSEQGHVKGLCFEEDLYGLVAAMGRQFGDETELVRGTPGLHKCKKGDHLITLGEATGAPGLQIVVEAKDQELSAKKAITELQEAKKNRGAISGIFVFAKGQEPQEFGNFKRIDNDFYCTADKAEMLAGSQPLFLWAAYEIARVQAVMTVRKEGAGKLDLERIQKAHRRDNLMGSAAWGNRNKGQDCQEQWRGHRIDCERDQGRHQGPCHGSSFVASGRC